jgi:hypothetical protein
MRGSIILFVVLLAGNLAVALGDEPPVAKRAIVISVGEGPFSFGSQIPVQVSYQNDDETEAWNINTPEKSEEVIFRYLLEGSKYRAKGFKLGRGLTTTRTLPNGKTMIAYLGSPVVPLSIAPMDDHEFVVQFEHHWTGHVVPGYWTIWLEDHLQQLESNRIKIPLRFTKESVEACQAIAKDPMVHTYERKTHGKWLERIDPDLKLVWSDSEDLADVKAEREAAIQKQLQEFAEYWKDAQNSRKMARTIAKINREANLEPEEEESEE